MSFPTPFRKTSAAPSSGSSRATASGRPSSQAWRSAEPLRLAVLGGVVRLSEFWIAVTEEFGEAYGRMLVHDLVLTELGGVTGEVALRQGASPRDIWVALCRASDVPSDRWHGVGRLREP
ncbi:DUF3046 domain-containing protein [Salinibacterium sp. dk2585]|nr:DUF3046 domain-containing protein [Salinibacterium sp. dk2585]TXK54789.1 DUF3046 domain-containing protein [Salinibacterium sp. dk5596]